jgi:hypothetical protein
VPSGEYWQKERLIVECFRHGKVKCKEFRRHKFRANLGLLTESKLLNGKHRTKMIRLLSEIPTSKQLQNVKTTRPIYLCCNPDARQAEPGEPQL